jgi:Sec-independent protein translocase protein TatA
MIFLLFVGDPVCPELARQVCRWLKEQRKELNRKSWLNRLVDAGILFRKFILLYF